MPPARPRPSPPLPPHSMAPLLQSLLQEDRAGEESRNREAVFVGIITQVGRSFVCSPARPPAGPPAAHFCSLHSPSFSPPLRCGCRLGCYGGCLRLFQQQRRQRRPTANSHESAAAVHQPTSNSTTSASDREGGGRDDHAYLPSERDGGISNSNARILRSRASRKSNKLFEFSYAQT